MKKRQNRWTKLTALFATLLAVMLIATDAVSAYAPVINSTLGTATSEITGLNPDAVYYPLNTLTRRLRPATSTASIVRPKRKAWCCSKMRAAKRR